MKKVLTVLALTSFLALPAAAQWWVPVSMDPQVSFIVGNTEQFRDNYEKNQSQLAQEIKAQKEAKEAQIAAKHSQAAAEKPIKQSITIDGQSNEYQELLKSFFDKDISGTEKSYLLEAYAFSTAYNVKVSNVTILLFEDGQSALQYEARVDGEEKVHKRNWTFSFPLVECKDGFCKKIGKLIMQSFVQAGQNPVINK